MAEFKDRLAEAMRIRGVRAIDIASSTSISKSLMSHYLSGECKAKQDKVAELASYLRVSEAWLLGYDVEMRYQTNDEKLAETEKLKLALFGGAGEVTDDMWRETLEAVEFIKYKHGLK